MSLIDDRSRVIVCTIEINDCVRYSNDSSIAAFVGVSGASPTEFVTFILMMHVILETIVKQQTGAAARHDVLGLNA